MSLPGFTAHRALVAMGRQYHGRYALSSCGKPGVVVPQRCEKACAQDCSEECNVRCKGTKPPGTPPPTTHCRKICCVNGQPQLA
jgi:hypothetical protein